MSARAGSPRAASSAAEALAADTAIARSHAPIEIRIRTIPRLAGFRAQASEQIGRVASTISKEGYRSFLCYICSLPALGMRCGGVPAVPVRIQTSEFDP